eukprot:gene5916-4231_t
MYDDRPVGGGVEIDFTLEVEEDFSNYSVEKLVKNNPQRFKNDLLINIKKVSTESNAAGLEDLMEALNAIVPLSNNDELDLLRQEPLILAIEKGVTGRPKAVSAAEQFISSLVERNKDVFTPLLSAFAHRTPKNKIAAIHTCGYLVREYGTDNFPIRSIMKALLPSFGDPSPQIRKEAILLCCDIYKCIGESIKAYLTDIRESQLAELEKKFSELNVDLQIPTKKIMEAPETRKRSPAPVSEKDKSGNISEERFFQLEESPVLSRLPRDFFTKALDKSAAWQDRCGLVTDHLIPLLSQPRLKRDNYHELAAFMREYLVDPQAPPMLLGFKMIQECARGMRSDFSPHARGYLHVLFDKMKDKKTSIQEHVFVTLEKLILFRCVSLDQCLEEIELTTTSKNPSQRLSLIHFCIRIIEKLEPDDIGKLAVSHSMLERMVNDEKLENRETGYLLVAKLASIFGEKTYEPIIDRMEEKQRLRYFAVAAHLHGDKQPGALKTPSSSPAKKVLRVEDDSEMPNQKQNDAYPRRTSAQRESQPRSTHSRPLKSIVNPDDGISLEGTLPKKDLVMTTMLGLSNGDTALLDLLRSNEWNKRCEGVERVRAMVSLWTAAQCAKYFNILLVYLRTYPGLHESTFQVFQAVRTVLQEAMNKAAVISQGAGYVLVTEYTPRLTEPKNKNVVRETCNAIAERFGPRFVTKHMITAACQIHTPKLLQEVNEYITELIQQYPAKSITSAPLDVKGILDYIKSPCLDQASHTARIPTVRLLAALRRHAGPSIDEFVEALPPAVQSLYDQEFDRKASTFNALPKSVSPTAKRVRSSSCQSSPSTNKKNPYSENEESHYIDELKVLMKALTTEMDWKKRLDALHRIEEQLSSMTGEILPGPLTEHLMKVLSSRFAESNRNFVVDVLRMIPLVVEVSDPLASRTGLTKHIMPAVLCMLGDQKSNLREEARNVSNIGMQTVGLEGLLQQLVKPLNSDSNVCRQNVLELVLYGFGQLPRETALPKNRLSQLVPGVVNALMDRISDVRLLAEQVTGYMIRYIGGDPFFRYIFQLKPAEQNVVTPAVERQFQLHQAGASESQLNSTINTEVGGDTPTSRLHSERMGSSTRDVGSARNSSAVKESASARRPSERERGHHSNNSSYRGQESNSFCRSATASELPKAPRSHTSAAVSISMDDEYLYSVEEILSGMPSADAGTGCTMCIAFRKHLKTGVDCCSAEMVQVMVDRLSRSASQMEETLALELCQSLSEIFLDTRSAHKYQKTFLVSILGSLFNGLLSDQIKQSQTVIKALNNMVLKLLEGCMADEIFSALLARLTSYSTTYLQTGRKEDLKYVQVTVKCIMRHNIQNVSPENVIRCCNGYLLQHPPSTFRSMDDLPVRTVKTILQTATRQYGHQLLPMSVRLIGPDNLVTHFIRACLETKDKAADNERQAREESVQQTRASMSSPKRQAQSPMKRTPPGTASTQHADPSSAIGRLQSTGRSQAVVLNNDAGPAAAAAVERVASQPAKSSTTASSPLSLGLIFNKIRNYQTSSEGIEELFLYLKKQKNVAPEEFDHHFNRCSEPFRFFIKRRLEKKVQEDTTGPRVQLPAVITSLS